MTGREFLIAFERELSVIFPEYNKTQKLSVDQIMYFINKSKNEYVLQLYRVFQQNQEISDNLRNLVDSTTYTQIDKDMTVTGRNCYSVIYPSDYLFTLGEQIYIKILDNKCDNLQIKASGVLEATIENLNGILDNSLTEYHLHHNQAKPVRVFTDNKILLYTDGNYEISKYHLTFLKKAKDIRAISTEEYTELPSNTHKDIVTMAVQDFISLSAVTKQSQKNDAN